MTIFMNAHNRQRLASRTFETIDVAEGRSATSYPSMNMGEIDLHIEIAEVVDRQVKVGSVIVDFGAYCFYLPKIIEPSNVNDDRSHVIKQ